MIGTYILIAKKKGYPTKVKAFCWEDGGDEFDALELPFDRSLDMLGFNANVQEVELWGWNGVRRVAKKGDYVFVGRGRNKHTRIMPKEEFYHLYLAKKD